MYIDRQAYIRKGHKGVQELELGGRDAWRDSVWLKDRLNLIYRNTSKVDGVWKKKEKGEKKYRSGRRGIEKGKKGEEGEVLKGVKGG